ncbi:hypothetical protein Poli38472_000275 [Pythium oligandrum]|uniref:Uncharacterized protein n=1 Tax=Pythium oligandrum TaxID=41045 RepID=A0A8K1CCQ7_PYTOL|nr:hypothetical protein Poli38472_000275 [Pythium oligandrum]|eukprot:TMW60233.1 hypothetical protein Poli38472_000275 [Pythium oligandrum]
MLQSPPPFTTEELRLPLASQPPRHAQLQQNVLTKIALGGVANMTAASITNPIDVIKVRLQLQSLATAQPNAVAAQAETGYLGFSHGLKTILREEGAMGLAKGMQATLIREGSYGALRFGLYDVVKDFYEEKMFPSAANAKITPLYIKLLAGATSGALGSALANPMDLVKVRMQGDRTGARYQNSFVVACRDIYRHDGLIKGFYRGVGATTLRAVVLTASQLPSYDHMKATLLNSPSLGMEEGFQVHMIASMFAGLVAATASSPVDVLKTKIMNECSKTAACPQQFQNSSQLLRRTFMNVLRTDGVRGFFKGWLPNWFRLGPHTIISLMIYEELRAAVGINPI